MSCPNCKCNKSNISQDEYEELKEYFQEEIQDFKIIDYISKENEHNTYVEVELEDYIVELENIDTDNLNLDKIVDTLIRNTIK